MATDRAGTSISSGKDGAATDQIGVNRLTEGVNPRVNQHPAQRGSTTPQGSHHGPRAGYHGTEHVTRPGSPLSTAAGFAAPRGIGRT
ncbi:hypothetical protein ACFY8O_09230 [Streptomyces argenteolus]|uniref:Uncharacterized protein n=1 Tax=Streptomyces argenteolus TaxID=67274 RepID=A0ABW6X380_9ACTN